MTKKAIAAAWFQFLLFSSELILYRFIILEHTNLDKLGFRWILCTQSDCWNSLSYQTIYCHLRISPPQHRVPTTMAPLTHLGNRLTSHQIAELCEFWAAEQGVPSLESRRAWSSAHQIDSSIVNKWFSRKKRSANKSKTMSNSVDNDNLLVSTHAMSNDVLDEKLSADQPNRQRKQLLVDSTDEPSHIDLPLTQESLADDMLPLLTLEGDNTCTTVPTNTAVNSNTLTPPLLAYTPLNVLRVLESASLPRDLDDFHDTLCLPSRIYLVSREGEIYCDDGAISPPSSPYHPSLSSSPFVDDFPGWKDEYSPSNISDRHLPEEEIQEDRWMNLIEMVDPEPFTSTPGE